MNQIQRRTTSNIQGIARWNKEYISKMIKRFQTSSPRLSIFSSSTSKIKVAPPGIFGGEPRSPYPRSEGMTSLRFSPSHMLETKEKTWTKTELILFGLKGISSHKKLWNILCSSSCSSSNWMSLRKLGNELHFLVFNFCTTKHHHHSTQLVQEGISKIRNLLPTVPNRIKILRDCSWWPTTRQYDVLNIFHQ